MANRKQTYRFSPEATRAINFIMRGSNSCIPGRNFQRMVKAIVDENKYTVKFQAGALRALQEGLELFAVNYFEDMAARTPAPEQ